MSILTCDWLMLVCSVTCVCGRSRCCASSACRSTGSWTAWRPGPAPPPPRCPLSPCCCESCGTSPPAYSSTVQYSIVQKLWYIFTSLGAEWSLNFQRVFDQVGDWIWYIVVAACDLDILHTLYLLVSASASSGFLLWSSMAMVSRGSMRLYLDNTDDDMADKSN